MRTRIGIRKAIWCVLIAAAMIGHGGCNNDKTSDRDLISVDPSDAVAQLSGKGSLLGGKKTGAWVDPRSPAAYAKGHIPGAINIPFSEVSVEHEQLKAYPILIVYGGDYGDDKAQAMAKRLIELEHKDVRMLRGGLQAWQNAGNPVETGPAKK